MIKLKNINLDYANKVLELQQLAFKSLLDKYQDYDMNPGAEKLVDITRRMKQPYTKYYMIEYDKKEVGAIRIIESEKICRISPMFIIPEFQNFGLGQKVLVELEKLYNVEKWILDTILEEKKLCHLYEKMGYIKTGEIDKIKENMHIVYYEKVRKNE